MPLSNNGEARDAIYARLKTVVDASAYSAIATYYPDSVGAAPDGVTSYLRANVIFTNERQASLGETGNRRFRVYGIVTVQVFTKYGDGQTLADAISGVVKSAFRGVNTGSDAITFRNTQIVDVGRDGSYLQTNVTAEFDYDEIA